MKKLFIAMAVGAAALLGGSAANAADNTVKAKAATDVTQSSISSTDISSRRRYRHYGYRHYRPYYSSYRYAPQPYYRGDGRNHQGACPLRPSLYVRSAPAWR